MQSCLEDLFEEWGLPDQIRFDNGKPWGNPAQRHVPRSLALWLVGLGIDPVFGRPRQSTDNAVVERCHGVLIDWVEPQHRAGLVDLQATLDEFVHIQRAVYPACQGQSRFAAHPDLMLARRTYHRDQDHDLWQLQRVMTYLSNFRFQRRVEKNGRITHLTQEYFVGRQYAAQNITIYMDAETHQWQLEDRQGNFIKSLPARQLDYPTIVRMELAYRSGKT